ncbi:fimbrial protein [Providencia hangzhouensis]|uniref:fimbrial protein n=1 Tax=Providencia TaxID=586 RepID=UPI000D98A208|nr:MULTISPECIES: fimbrial protein [Providencia]MRF65053.1 hypothetical protein [Escherichia coli]PYZ60325.1 hypothetical protein DNK63_14940 [Providencia rettgeri]QIF65088.1 hypothetical protein FVA72_05945 [Providencia sp. 1709051003]WOB96286.1 fimbrial protein [Providencia sp. PROV099]
MKLYSYRYCYIFGIVFSLCPLFSSASDLSLNFTGNAVVTGCDVEFGNSGKNQEIDFKTVTTTKSGTGLSGLVTQPFSLKLSSCVGTINKVSVSMSGKADTGFPEYFAINSGTGSAQGLVYGVNVKGDKNKKQKPDGTVVEWSSTAQPLEYEATLYKTGNVDGGLAQASIDISIGYQ